MSRKMQFAADEYFHIFNRGVDGRKIIEDSQDIFYFLDNLVIYNSTILIDQDNRINEIDKSKRVPDLVSIVAFAILPNHFHLLLKEIQPGGISKFMHKAMTSYTMYFNKKHNRSGTLFQGRFKATHVADPIAVSSYVNLNYIHHKYDSKKHLFKTSRFEYENPERVKDRICDKNEIENIIKMAGGLKRYKLVSRDWSKVFVETHER